MTTLFCKKSNWQLCHKNETEEVFNIPGFELPSTRLSEKPGVHLRVHLRRLVSHHGNNDDAYGHNQGDQDTVFDKRAAFFPSDERPRDPRYGIRLVLDFHEGSG
jgi:hypothetical protein